MVTMFQLCTVASLLMITSWRVQISNRLMLALSLLKKEYELSKLQQKIGKEVRYVIEFQHCCSVQ